jgi:hypothetical protein
LGSGSWGVRWERSSWWRGEDFQDALAGETVSDKWLKHTLNTTGAIFALPTGQAANTGQFLWDVFEGNQDPETASEWLNGILKGDANSKH